MLALVLRQVGIIDDGLEISLYACRRSLQFVCGILSELALQSLLVLLRVAQFPVEMGYGVGDVSQFIVWHALFQLLVKLLAALCLQGKLPQITDVAAHALGVAIEHKTQYDGKDEGEIDVGVVSLEAACEFGGVGDSRPDNVGALGFAFADGDAGGGIEISVVSGLRQSLDVIAAPVMQSLSDFPPLQVVLHAGDVVVARVGDDSAVSIYDGDADALGVVGADEMLKLVGRGDAVAEPSENLVVVGLQHRLHDVNLVFLFAVILVDGKA